MENVTAIALVVGITMRLIKFIEFGTTKFFEFLNKTANKCETDNKQEIEIAVLQTDVKEIKTNHLVHIQASLDKNTAEHTDIKVALGKICQKLEVE